MRWRDAFVNIGRSSFVAMLDILNAVKISNANNRNGGYTAREALNIELISDDFPTPDCWKMNPTCIEDRNKSYLAHDKDPESMRC